MLPLCQPWFSHSHLSFLPIAFSHWCHQVQHCQGGYHCILWSHGRCQCSCLGQKSQCSGTSSLLTCWLHCCLELVPSCELIQPLLGSALTELFQRWHWIGCAVKHVFNTQHWSWRSASALAWIRTGPLEPCFETAMERSTFSSEHLQMTQLLSTQSFASGSRKYWRDSITKWSRKELCRLLNSDGII